MTSPKLSTKGRGESQGLDEGDDDDKKGTMGPSGAAQTTVAVATIAFSMAMARLAF